MKEWIIFAKEAWRPLPGAGHRHRTVQSPAGWRQVAAAEEGPGIRATRKKAARDEDKGAKGAEHTPSRKRSRAVTGALEREGHSAASKGALSRHARASAKKRGPASRKEAAQKAPRTGRGGADD